jgi:hypothetical protein
LKNALTKLISKEECLPSYVLRNVSIAVRNKADTPKKDESTGQKPPNRSHTRPLLGMDAVPNHIFSTGA